MSLVVHFSPDLGPWLVESLVRGESPEQVVRAMVAERMDPRVACSIVEAFEAARHAGRPLPTTSIVMEENGPSPYAAGAPRLPAGSRIRTGDRTVRVLARAARPMVAVLGGVLDPEECAQVMDLARPRLLASTVVDPVTGQDVVAPYRDSRGMFFRPQENSLIARLDRRVAEVMNLPVENGEGFQVLHYGAGGGSAPHHDFLQAANEPNRASIARSGQRVSTLVIYLNDVERGGETTFPGAGWAVSPVPGNAVYFEYGNGLGQVDERTLHAGGPVLEGEKWVLTKWMRERRFVPAGSSASDGMMGAAGR